MERLVLLVPSLLLLLPFSSSHWIRWKRWSFQTTCLFASDDLAATSMCPFTRDLRARRSLFATEAEDRPWRHTVRSGPSLHAPEGPVL